MTSETEYVLCPATFYSVQEARDLIRKLRDALQNRSLGTPDFRTELVELFNEIVVNAAEHGMTIAGADAHIRYMPHRRDHAFDCVVVDRGPGIPAPLANRPSLEAFENDADAIRAAVTDQAPSTTGVPFRVPGLQKIHLAMQKTGRALSIHSGTGLLRIRGDGESHFSDTGYYAGTVVRMLIPKPT